MDVSAIAMNAHFVAVGVGRSVFVFDLAHGEQTAKFDKVAGIEGVGFLPDREEVISWGGSFVWRDSIYPDAFQNLCAKLTRDLTRLEWNRWFTGSAYKRACPALP